MQCHMPARAGRAIQKLILNMREGSRTTRKERSDIQIASRNRGSSTLHRVHITYHLTPFTKSNEKTHAVGAASDTDPAMLCSAT